MLRSPSHAWTAEQMTAWPRSTPKDSQYETHSRREMILLPICHLAQTWTRRMGPTDRFLILRQEPHAEEKRHSDRWQRESSKWILLGSWSIAQWQASPKFLLMEKQRLSPIHPPVIIATNSSDQPKSGPICFKMNDFEHWTCYLLSKCVILLKFVSKNTFI